MRQILKNKPLSQTGAFIALCIVTASCTVLATLVIALHSTQQAGIATLSLTFKISDIPVLHSKMRGLPGQIGSIVHSATAEGASLAATATADGASLIASAASAAKTAEMAIEALLPQNLSIGISHFCVGFSAHTECIGLPLSIPNLIPEAINHASQDLQNSVNNQFQSLQYLEEVTANITSTNIKAPLIFGATLFIIFAATLFCRLFMIRTAIHNSMKIAVSILATLFCFLFVIPTAILSYAGSKIQESGPIVHIQEGGAVSLAIGATVCATMILLLTVVILLLDKADSSSRT